VCTEAALTKQLSDMKTARQQAEQQREELTQRAQQLQSKSQENAVSGKYCTRNARHTHWARSTSAETKGLD